MASLAGVSRPPFLRLGGLLGRFGIDAWHNAFGGTTGFTGRDFRNVFLMFRSGFLGLDWVERGLLIGCIIDIGIDVSLNPMVFL